MGQVTVSFALRWSELKDKEEHDGNTTITGSGREHEVKQREEEGS